MKYGTRTPVSRNLLQRFFQIPLFHPFLNSHALYSDSLFSLLDFLFVSVSTVLVGSIDVNGYLKHATRRRNGCIADGQQQGLKIDYEMARSIKFEMRSRLNQIGENKHKHEIG